jgi:plastocyanin
MKTHPSPMLAGVLILLATFAQLSCSDDDDSNPQQPGPAADVTVNIVADAGSNSFSPNPVTITAGQTVAWRNQHNTTHTATALPGEVTAFSTGNISPSGTSAAINVFAAADTVSYRCTLHPTMTGTVIVTP